MKIMKFGGTSVGSAARIQEVARLVQKEGRTLVVLSAMSGTTNSLVEIAGYLYNRNADGARDVIGRLEAKYLKTIQELYSKEESRAAAEAFIRQTFEGITGTTRELFGAQQEKLILPVAVNISCKDVLDLYISLRFPENISLLVKDSYPAVL